MSKPTRPTVTRAKDGRMLCTAHRTSGAPTYHYAGCEACIDARAKGINRPDADSVPARLRGRRRHHEKHIDWEKVKPENRGALAGAISAGCLGAIENERRAGRAGGEHE
jgi:hypothetical protein